MRGGISISPRSLFFIILSHINIYIDTILELFRSHTSFVYCFWNIYWWNLVFKSIIYWMSSLTSMLFVKWRYFNPKIHIYYKTWHKALLIYFRLFNQLVQLSHVRFCTPWFLHFHSCKNASLLIKFCLNIIIINSCFNLSFHLFS